MHAVGDLRYTKSNAAVKPIFMSVHCGETTDVIWLQKGICIEYGEM